MNKYHAQNDLITEKDWDKIVVGLYTLLGYEVLDHPFLSLKSPSGWPDRTIYRGVDENWPFLQSMYQDIPLTGETRLIFLELKKESGQPTFNQWNCLRILQGMGYEAYIIRPSDFEWLAEILR